GPKLEAHQQPDRGCRVVSRDAARLRARVAPRDPSGEGAEASMTAPPLAGPRKVLVVMSDLLFRSKVDEVARRVGLELRAAKSFEQLDRQLAAGAPALAIVDLEEGAFDA